MKSNVKDIKKRSWLAHIVLLVLCLSPLMFFACFNDSSNGKNTNKDLFENNPVTITWDNNSSKEIKSYEADVEVYSMNNRTDTYTKLSDKYRIIMKEINGTMHTRLDFSAKFNDGVARSIISNGSEIIMFDTKTEKIEQRISIEDKVAPNLKLLLGDNCLSRVNLSLIKSEARKLAFDLTEDNENSIMQINLPSALFKNDNDDQKISTRIYFDTKNETLANVEIVEKSEDGTEIITTTSPVYEEKNGVPVKIGDITEIETKTPELAASDEEETAIINSPDDIDTIDQSTADALVAEGSATENTNMTFGDPNDLSNVETVITICNEVKLNQASDNAFKLITGGK
jgi:hypothetical protein